MTLKELESKLEAMVRFDKVALKNDLMPIPDSMTALIRISVNYNDKDFAIEYNRINFKIINRQHFDKFTNTIPEVIKAIKEMGE